MANLLSKKEAIIKIESHCVILWCVIPLRILPRSSTQPEVRGKPCEYFAPNWNAAAVIYSDARGSVRRSFYYLICWRFPNVRAGVLTHVNFIIWTGWWREKFWMHAFLPAQPTWRRPISWSAPGRSSWWWGRPWRRWAPCRKPAACCEFS